MSGCLVQQYQWSPGQEIRMSLLLTNDSFQMMVILYNCCLVLKSYFLFCFKCKDLLGFFLQVFKSDKMNGFEVQSEADAMMERQKRDIMPGITTPKTPTTHRR